MQNICLWNRRRRVPVCNTRDRKGAVRRVGDTIVDKVIYTIRNGKPEKAYFQIKKASPRGEAVTEGD